MRMVVRIWGRSVRIWPSSPPILTLRNYGFARLSDLAEASGILEVERIDEQKVVMVKLKKGRRR